jgi:uncharacterized membrane protein YphA (DoxX/SURF4 family)
MPEQLYPWMHLVGRILFSLIFIASGLNQLLKVNDYAAYARSKGLPAAKASAVVSGLMILVGGVFVLLGWHRFIGAGLIFVFLVLSSVTMHQFWKERDPLTMQNEMAHFMKDLALAGAALFIAYYGGTPWPMSLGAP